MRRLCNNASEPSPAVMGKMAAVSWPPNTGAMWMTSAIQAMILSPDCNRRGESKYYTSSDPNQWQNQMKFILHSEEIMQKATTN